METILTIENENELKDIVSQLVAVSKNKKIWVLQGDMGAGKTTLVKHLCEYWNCEEQASSPTYSIVNEYYSAAHGLIYHFDFYRINHVKEALDFGCEEYLDSGKLCLLEWASNIKELLSGNEFVVSIKLGNTPAQRIITCSHHAAY